MAQLEPIVFEVLSSYSSEVVGERVPVRAIVPNQSNSFISENARGSLRQISLRKEISLIAKESALNLLKISHEQSTAV